MSSRGALGIDIGTSSVKATLIFQDGTSRSSRSGAYPTDRPHEGWAEQDPERWWTAVGEAVAPLGAAIDGADVTIGLTGQMHTSVLTDSSGAVVRPAILWSDQRSAQQAAELMLRHPEVAEISGNTLIPAFTLSHLLWLREHEPAVLNRAHTIAVPKDHLRARLGAGCATEPSDASAMALLDYRTDHWSAELLRHAHMRESQLPPVVASHAFTGTVTTPPPGAEALRGSRVVGGAGDQAAQAVALGVTVAGSVGVSLGTSGVAFSALQKPAAQSFRHAFPNTWLALDSMHAAGLALTWWSRITGVAVPKLSAGAVERTHPPLFLPHLQGHRGMHGAPGAFIGLDSGQDAFDLARGIMEGVAAELVALVGSVGGSDAPMVHLGGGGGRSPVWRQILADALDRPVSFSDRDSSLGAALIAAEAAGWADEFHAADVTVTLITEPQDAAGARSRLERYRDAAARFAPTQVLAP